MTTCPILTSGLATATAAGAGQCFMWELAAGAGHYMIGLAGFSAQTGRYQNTERTWLREQTRGDHLMVQSLNTLINSIHFAPRRQGFVSIHGVFVTLSCSLPKTAKTTKVSGRGNVPFLRGSRCLDDKCGIMMFSPALSRQHQTVLCWEPSDGRATNDDVTSHITTRHT